MKMIKLHKGDTEILAPETDVEYLTSVGWSEDKPKAKPSKAKSNPEEPQEID
jgi:hypothetical protein